MLECNKAYIDARMLRMHKRKVHGIGIYCKGCEVDFSCEDELDEHKERYHASEKNVRKEWHSCIECEEIFLDEEDLEDHMWKIHKTKCDQCGKKYECMFELEEHRKTEHEIGKKF